MTTEIVLITLTIILILWDVLLGADKKPGNTITQAIQKWSFKYPIIPFFFGFLMGHLFGDF